MMRTNTFSKTMMKLTFVYDESYRDVPDDGIRRTGFVFMDVVFDDAFGGVGDEKVVIGEGVVVISSSLDILTNSCLGGIMVSLIFLEGLDEEALVEFMVEWCEEDEDDDRSEEDDLFN
ncbi:hypothetical protein Tco_1499445 [Tanacetum coccineum]